MKNLFIYPNDNIEKIAQIGDVHIRLTSRHDEYQQCFDQLYKDLHTCLDGYNSVIVLTGDIVHSKLEMSPELIQMTSEFIKSCADMFPTILIPGNHDSCLNSSTRIDALTPIIELLNHPKLFYLKKSDIYSANNINFYSWSIQEPMDKWPKITQSNKTNICLFHGAIHGSMTDVGYVINNRNVKVETFTGFDMVLAGDIHKYSCLQQYDGLNKKPEIAYNSSLICQSFGELPKGHGWVEWDIQTCKHKFHELENDYGYYTIKIEDKNIPDYSDMPKKVRLRIFGGGLTQTEIKKLLIEIRSKHDIIESQVTNYSGAKKDQVILSKQILDIYNVDYQNKLIKEYIKLNFPKLKQTIIDRVINLNIQTNLEIDNDENKKIIWTPISMEFDNLFTYEEGNTIDFTNLKDVIGIFAPNFSGKTSLANSICFALYDRTPQTNKAIEIMNTRKSNCRVIFKFKIEKQEFVIERTGTRNKNGEVKTEVNFYTFDADNEEVSLNGEDRRYTDKNIMKYVGSFEDFLLTTFSSSSQLGLFVDRGQSERKDLLSQFLGLNIFDKLYDVASDDSKDILYELKQFKKDDFSQEVVQLQIQQGQFNQKIIYNSQISREYKIQLDEIDAQLKHKYEQKIPLNKKFDINKITQDINNAQLQLDNENLKYEVNKKAKEELNNKLAEANIQLENLKNSEIKYQEYNILLAARDVLKSEIDEYIRQIKNINEHKEVFESEIKHANKLINKNNEQLIILNKHQYDPSCKFCLLNGNHTIESIKKLGEDNIQNDNLIYSCTIDIDLLCQQLEDIKLDKEPIIKQLNNKEEELKLYSDVIIQYNKYTDLKNWINNTLREIDKYEITLSKYETNVNILNNKLELCKKEYSDYLEQIESIEINNNLDEFIKNLENNKLGIQTKLTNILSYINKDNTQLEILKQKEQNLLDKITKAESLEENAIIYQTYLDLISRDGLPYKLITDLLPSLEFSINNTLSQIVPFTLGFDADGKNINIRIIYDENRQWPLGLASGMEKFISSLAIRVALSEISTLPKTGFLILDEGLGVIDADNMASLPMLFNMLRTKYNFILLISHVENARDIADSLIEIQRKDGFSKIQA